MQVSASGGLGSGFMVKVCLSPVKKPEPILLSREGQLIGKTDSSPAAQADSLSLWLELLCSTLADVTNPSQPHQAQAWLKVAFSTWRPESHRQQVEGGALWIGGAVRGEAKEGDTIHSRFCKESTQVLKCDHRERQRKLKSYQNSNEEFKKRSKACLRGCRDNRIMTLQGTVPQMTIGVLHQAEKPSGKGLEHGAMAGLRLEAVRRFLGG